MIVVAIMGILLTMSVPLVYKIRNREPMNKAVRDFVEVCSNARARAILQGRMTELVCHPRDGRFEVGGAGPPVTRVEPVDVQLEDPLAPKPPPPPPPSSGLSCQFSDEIMIEMLDVNLVEYKDEEFARVRFYPNGTCDEMTLIVRSLSPRSGNNDWAGITLEVTTGLASVVTDRNKLQFMK